MLMWCNEDLLGVVCTACYCTAMRYMLYYAITPTGPGLGRQNLASAVQALEKGENEPPKGFLSEVFAGQLSSRVACEVCHHTSVTLEPFMDLSLPIPAGTLADMDDSISNRYAAIFTSATSTTARGSTVNRSTVRNVLVQCCCLPCWCTCLVEDPWCFCNAWWPDTMQPQFDFCCLYAAKVGHVFHAHAW